MAQTPENHESPHLSGRPFKFCRNSVEAWLLVRKLSVLVGLEFWDIPIRASLVQSQVASQKDYCIETLVKLPENKIIARIVPILLAHPVPCLQDDPHISPYRPYFVILKVFSACFFSKHLSLDAWVKLILSFSLGKDWSFSCPTYGKLFRNSSLAHCPSKIHPTLSPCSAVFEKSFKRLSMKVSFKVISAL